MNRNAFNELYGAQKIGRIEIKKALQCLNDNGIEKSECPEVLKALCYILYNSEIDYLLEDSDYDD